MSKAANLEKKMFNFTYKLIKTLIVCSYKENSKLLLKQKLKSMESFKKSDAKVRKCKKQLH